MAVENHRFLMLLSIGTDTALTSVLTLMSFIIGRMPARISDGLNIDEIETHLHTRVQGSLLKELFKILPEESQLWTTTHSLGILRAGQELSVEKPGSVCVIDFDAIDPDIPREIIPSSIGRVGWEKMLSVALDDLSTRIAPATIVVCEGSSLGNRRKDFDAEIFNRILGAETPDVLFVSGGSSGQVRATGVSISHTLS